MAIVAAGAYVPYRRLERGAIAGALGTSPTPGTRAVASYDEDTTTMGVEAARVALAGLPDQLRPRMLLFATADPAYLDKTNAAAVHAALGLDPTVGAYDLGGSARSGIGALRLAGGFGAPTLVVMADVRTGLPGGVDEREGGDGAAAFVVAHGSDAEITHVLGRGSSTLEFLDRWRLPGQRSSHVWEERFGEHAYVPLAQAAFADACKAADLTPDAIDHLIVTGVHARALRAISRGLGTRPDALVDDLIAAVGNTGTAHPGLVLASLLERVEPGRVVAVVHAADGADAVIFRTTDRIVAARHAEHRSVAAQVAGGSADLSYETFLTWRGFLDREPPRRPDPTAPAAPPSLRSEVWGCGFTASRCEQCGERHLPPARVCASCGAVDRMQTERMADVPATVATFTVDRLAYTPSPPLVAAVLDFDGGGRFRCELTDLDPASVQIGDRVEMTFRRVSTAQEVHNYFWKGRPLRT
jgi:hydroxymethylglutaryl-CoA synthase